MKQEASSWTKSSWKNFSAKQQPEWPDSSKLQATVGQISQLPPLVFAGEIRSLKKSLADAAQGKAFLLQGGDCAETFSECTAPSIREKLKVILQMAVVLTYAGEKPVIKVGRIAGQYGKPRSKNTEMVNGVELPSYRGDMVNAPDEELSKRIPDCDRLLSAYHHSASTLNILRAYTRGGYADLHRIHSWNNEFVKVSKQGEKYEKIAQQIDKALTFMKSIGLGPDHTASLKQVDYYTSHESLVLDYEEALTRQDSTTGDWYDCSGHMLWIGDRTRQVEGGHIEFFRGVKNPIGMKVGPNHDLDEIRRILDILNPENEYGRITLITRFGADQVEKYLPQLIRGVDGEGRKVLWSCDPMHGNTFSTDQGFKTRSFDNILKEIHQFFSIHWSENSIPGGIHLELTGEDVTECVGGAQEIEHHHLENNYKTACDPRLNAQQSLEIAYQVAEMLVNKKA